MKLYMGQILPVVSEICVPQSLDPICCQIFGQWKSPYGANGQMTMTVDNHGPRQFHRTSNGENPSIGYRDMGSASLAAARPTARPVTTIPGGPRGKNAQQSLQWRHNRRDSVSNHQHHDCLFNRLFRRRSKKTSELPVTGLCAGNSPVTGEFPAQMVSYAKNVSIWWRHQPMEMICQLIQPCHRIGDYCVVSVGCSLIL